MPILRHGAYVCVHIRDEDHPAALEAPVDALARRLGLVNEFETTAGHPDDAVAFLRRVDATAGDLDDAVVLRADAVVHVASPAASKCEEFCDEIARLLGAMAACEVHRGVVRPTKYTGGAMNEFAYAHQRLQQAAAHMPNAFFLPLKKTTAWWQKDWMERHAYFLPRYDEHGRMISQGHALTAAAGIPSLMRRTYQNATMPAPGHEYDFLTYFECADADVPTFHAVCAALRDTARNPEWAFVREGPLWRGRRVAAWSDLYR
jgi:hypothetical protein